MHGDVVFFGGAGEGEGVVLPDGDFGAAEEDVLQELVGETEWGKCMFLTCPACVFVFSFLI